MGLIRESPAALFVGVAVIIGMMIFIGQWRERQTYQAWKRQQDEG